VMDGYTATKEIRKWEETLPDVCAGNRPGIPIVAMTAHAMVGEKEKCLAAGMNDYLSKPIDQDKLYALLLKWIKPGGLDVFRIREKPVVNDDDVLLPCAVPGIDLADGLKRLGGNRKLYLSLLKDFANKYGMVSQEIEKVIQTGNFMAARNIAHTVKGTAGNLSVTGAQQAALELEEAITENDAEKYHLCLSRLAGEMRIVGESLKKIDQTGKETPSSFGTMTDPTQMAPLFQELSKLLEQSNADAEICFDAIRKSIDSSRFHQEMEELAARIADFDFSNALNCLRKIAEAMKITIEEKENG